MYVNGANVLSRSAAAVFPARLLFCLVKNKETLLFLLLLLLAKLSTILAQFSSDQILDRNIPKHSDPFFDNELNIYIVTWNVGNMVPKNQIDKLFETLRPDAPSPDVYAIGFQELPYVLYPNSITKLLNNYFVPKKYTKLSSVKRGTIRLYVYVRSEQFKKYFNVATNSIEHWFQTKASVAVRFFIKNLSICLVAAHLAAHEPFYEKRLEQFSNSIQNLKFSSNKDDILLNHDMIFFFGDLNFRIDTLTDEQVKQFIETKQYDQLLKNDQLYKTLVNKNSKITEGFHEANITFAPTFKFVQKTSVYNYAKRKPAYTDRVIYRNILAEKGQNFLIKKAAQFTVSDYKSIPDVMDSDHRPVTATISIPIMANIIAPSIWTKSFHSRNTRETDETLNDCNVKQNIPP